MKLRRILTLAAAAAIAVSVSGCSVKVNTNDFESVITSMKMSDDDVIASPSGEAYKDSEALAIDYLDFKKEYLYWLKSYEVTDDSDETWADKCAAQRESIITYLINERIINDKAHELGLDNFNEEELAQLEADYQANLKEQYEYFGTYADYDTLAADETIGEALLLERGEQEFDKYLADCLLTKDDLLMWQRNALIVEKIRSEITKDVVIEDSEAQDVLDGYLETVKEMYETDPVTYETGGQYMSFWLPDGTRKIKHILIAMDEMDSDEIAYMRESGDIEGADALRAEKLAPLEQQATEIINMLDNGADFDELIKEYSADAAGSAMYPDGYTVIPDSVGYVQEFVEAAYAIESKGDYILAATDYGWHIVMYADDAEISQETLDMYEGYVMETLVDTAKAEKFNSTLFQWQQEYGYEIDYEALALPEPVETAEAATAEAAE